MGSTKTENESNTLRGSVINSAQSSGKENNWKCDSQELFERKLVLYFVLHYSSKRFFMETIWSWNLVCCNIAHWHDWVSSLHARNEIEGVFAPLIANMLFASKNCSLEKVAFMNSSCFMICELNWIVFMLFKEKVLQETWSKYLVIWHDWVSCLHARNEIGRGFRL